MMKRSGRQYFSNLSDCLSKIEVRRESSVPLDIDEALDDLTNLVLKTKATGGKVILIGNGGSAAIASHQAVDLWKNGGIRAIAFNDASLLTCVSNDYGYEYVFEKPIDMFAEASDILIAISSSGRSPNILRAVDMAKSKGLTIVTLSGFKPDNPLRQSGHLNFYVPSGSYGFVEISHLTLCHYVCDRVMAEHQLFQKTVRQPERSSSKIKV